MQLTGHKTRAIFERYSIVSPGDLRDAARRLDRFLVTIGSRLSGAQLCHDLMPSSPSNVGHRRWSRTTKAKLIFIGCCAAWELLRCSKGGLIGDAERGVGLYNPPTFGLA
jgi:hypothetical protein